MFVFESSRLDALHRLAALLNIGGCHVVACLVYYVPLATSSPQRRKKVRRNFWFIRHSFPFHKLFFSLSLFSLSLCWSQETISNDIGPYTPVHPNNGISRGLAPGVYKRLELTIKNFVYKSPETWEGVAIVSSSFPHSQCVESHETLVEQHDKMRDMGKSIGYD